MMIGIKTLIRKTGLLGLMLAMAQPAFAAIHDVTYVASWDSVGSGNAVAVGGPGLSVGQKFVIRISYNDISTTIDDVDVLDAFFSPSGNLMRTIDLTEGSNSLDIFVPMEGLDSGGPFIYHQDETDHFPIFIPAPTLNFANGSSISLTSNIIGLEYEGDFVPGGVFNIIESFNTSPPQPDPPDPNDINMVSQILNCGDVTCATSPGIASNDTNLDNVNNGSGFAIAVALVVDAGTVVYNAGALTQTTASIITQSNDLGALRSDGEDFIDAVWVPTGTPTGNDIMVDIINSGLTMTTSVTTWDVTMTEQMTLMSDMDSAMVSYLNAVPTGSASATAVPGGTDFTLMYDDDDLVVNALIPGFEMLTVTALVDGSIPSTLFFAELISTGTQSSTNAALEAAFGTGAHTVVFLVTDKAGASVSPSADFEVVLAVCGNDIVEPGEECDGGACCTSSCEFESAATVCNAGSGDLCDPDELCTGSSVDCPADTIAPATTICRPGSGDICDPDESCTGEPNAACPADQVAPPTTICNPGSGDLCDPDESCSGLPGDVCPNDAIAPPTTICRPGSGDICDPDESCSGLAGDACPADVIAPATTICRPSSTGDETCDPSESCSGNADVACPPDFIAPEFTPCGDGSDTECTDPDSCDGAGVCHFRNQECGSVTSSALCEFDVEPDKGTCDGGTEDGTACSLGAAGACEGGGGSCAQSDQFRLPFAPDGRNWVAYKLVASNPGQFFYNAIYDASDDDDGVTFEIFIPYPFVTQGATPLHVYDADLVPSNGSGCLAPETALADAQTEILLEDWIQDAGYAAPAYLECDQVDQDPAVGEDGWCTITVDIPQAVIDATTDDLLYLNVHLDYGLKGPGVDANPFDDFVDRYDRAGSVSQWGSSDALENTSDNSGDVAIADCSVYDFAHDVGEVPQFADTVENLNFFKNISGAFGRVFCDDSGDAIAGFLYLERTNNPGHANAVASTEIDEDGYYLLGYKHKGKPTNYQIRWCDAVDCSGDNHVTDPFPLQGNATVEIDLEAVDSCDDLDGPDDSSDWVEITPVYFKGKFKN
jgi:hypothetical protein